MDNKKIGKFLSELRKEKGVTQEQVGFEIMTSRENISKWERGINMPTPDSLMLLSKYYDVTVNEILLGERKNEENKEQIENVSVEVIKAGNKRVKSVFKSFIIIITFMVVGFLSYYFVNTYNTIKVYKIDGMSDNFFINDGLAIFSKGKSYLRIGTIEPKTDIDYDSFEIFIKQNNKDNIVFVSNDDNYTLLNSFGYNDFYSYNNLNKIEKDTYIRIKYKDKEDVIKLNFQRDMTNNLFVDKSEKDIIIDKKVENYSEDIVKKLESYAKKNWSYNEDAAEYVYKGNNYTISYLSNPAILKIEEYENNNMNIIEFNLLSKFLTYAKGNGEKKEEIYKYNFDTKECFTGECDIEQANNYLNSFLYEYIK